MIIRRKIDIGFKELFIALIHCLNFKKKHDLLEGDHLFCLSVRTGLDLFLSSLNLKKGSEIIVSGINIYEMFELIEKHGLRPKPVSIDFDNLHVDSNDIEQEITKKTKAILIAHLFGSRMELNDVYKICQKNNLYLIEDSAQVFDGDISGYEGSDISLYSFGPKKTATCLGGAVLSVKDREILTKMKDIQSNYPSQSNLKYFFKINKFVFIKLLQCNFIYSIFYPLLQYLRIDFDRLLYNFKRDHKDLFVRIRKKPSRSLLYLLKYRTKKFDYSVIQKRTKLGRYFLDKIPLENRIGYKSNHHTFWCFPVISKNSSALIKFLQKHKIDATKGYHDFGPLKNIHCTDVKHLEMQKKYLNIVYLPFFHTMSKTDIDRIAETNAAYLN
ncbi:MAG: DegT/DnrJ/EryC1/StrS aminotransferase family protein [Deltaproteobacteria bacterium]|nr:DegT/DnrJ/EryC1/StrS aminotransferase family protein [Deltaproteobacteria bacterium]